MTKHANYMILPEFRLILECCKGQASVEDAISMKKTFSTVQAATKFLGIPGEVLDLINNKIIELNKKTI